MKNKADLDPIYWVDLLQSQKIIDSLFHSGEMWELVAPNDVVSTLQRRLSALANALTIQVRVPNHSGTCLDGEKAA